MSWEKVKEQEKDLRFVELGECLCEVRAKQYWRFENLNSFDEFLGKRFPDSRRKAYYLMTIHEHLTRVPKPELLEIGWTKARELVKVARRDGPEFASAGRGNLPETHVTIANRFSETTCLDISKVAIDIARSKLEGQGEFILGSILDIPKPANYFDASYCAHVIYHIEKDHQGSAIRELIRVTKPGGQIVVIYRNLDSLPHRFLSLSRLPLLPQLWKRRTNKGYPSHNTESQLPLYFFAHPLNWWAQFVDKCDITIRPWDVMANEEEEIIFINDTIASLGYRLCSWFENKYPDRTGRWWSYPLIILTKK